MACHESINTSALAEQCPEILAGLSETPRSLPFYSAGRSGLAASGRPTSIRGMSSAVVPCLISSPPLILLHADLSRQTEKMRDSRVA